MIRLWCLLSSLFIVCISACSSNTELGDLSSYTETELVAMIAAENNKINVHNICLKGFEEALIPIVRRPDEPWTPLLGKLRSIEARLEGSRILLLDSGSKDYGFRGDAKDISEIEPYVQKAINKNIANIKALRKEISRRNKQ